MTDYTTSIEETGGVLTVRAATEETFRDLEGNEKTVETVVAKVSIEADDDLALAIGRELEAYYAGEQGVDGRGDGKPIHQQIAEAEDR